MGVLAVNVTTYLVNVLVNCQTLCGAESLLVRRGHSILEAKGQNLFGVSCSFSWTGFLGKFQNFVLEIIFLGVWFGW